MSNEIKFVIVSNFSPAIVNAPLFLFTIWTTPIILKEKKL